MALKKQDKENSQDNIPGLCSTCKYCSGCSFRMSAKTPVWQCNEFETAPSPGIEITDEYIAKLTRSAEDVLSRDSNRVDEDSKFVGLCKNCDNRGHCTYTRPNVGVWHCEEYL